MADLIAWHPSLVTESTSLEDVHDFVPTLLRAGSKLHRGGRQAGHQALFVNLKLKQKWGMVGLTADSAFIPYREDP